MTLICLQPLIAQAEEPPSSSEQLLFRVDSALKTRKAEGILGLINWQGVSEEMRAFTTRMISGILQEDIVKVSLSSDQTEMSDISNGYTRDGILYQPNVSVMGVIVFQFKQKGNFVRMAYGKSDNAFYIASVVEKRIYVPKVKEKSLQITVGTFSELQTGYCNYLKNGKEIRLELNRKGGTHAFWGDRITYCKIQGGSPDDEIWLVISEDSQPVFETKPKKTAKPIEYKAISN
jgi:hypothetical protein